MASSGPYYISECERGALQTSTGIEAATSSTTTKQGTFDARRIQSAGAHACVPLQRTAGVRIFGAGKFFGTRDASFVVTTIDVIISGLNTRLSFTGAGPGSTAEEKH